MQPATDPANLYLNPEGRAAAPHPLAAGLRGLGILQLALILELGARLLSGVTQAFLMSTGTQLGMAMSVLSLVMTGWQLVFLGTAVAELVALTVLGGAPPAARVGELARAAFGVRTLGLVMALGMMAVPTLLRASLSSHNLSSIYVYVGFAETVVSLVGTILLVELLLRLRRFAAPSDRQLVENEALSRAGVMGALVARLITNYVAYALVFRFFGLEHTAHWLAFAVRMPFTMLFYALLLGLVQSTRGALLRYRPDAAAGGEQVAAPADGAVAGEANVGAYRNMLFGGLWTLGGIAVTLATYLNAHDLGGRYTIAYGAIFLGVVQFVRGLTQLGGRQ